MTEWSNTSAVSLFDALVFVIALGLALGWSRAVFRGLREHSLKPAGRVVMNTATTGALLYLWFSLAWGLNYARPALEAELEFARTRVTPDAVRALAVRATVAVNRGYADAHAAGFPEPGEMPADLVAAAHDVERRLGRSRPTQVSRPKRTLLGPFFRAAGVDGMHAPFLLETLLNPDLTAVERPAVLAHEWAHLAGYAPEADASFVGLLSAMRAGAASSYSAWLALLDEAVSQLPGAEQRDLLNALADGPRADRAAIARRLERRIDVVSRASWQTYDRYLKVQGVEEGIRSYSRVVELLLGTGALDWR